MEFIASIVVENLPKCKEKAKHFYDVHAHLLL